MLTDGVGPIVVWLVLAAVVLLLEAPMWRNHLAHLVVPAALLVGVIASSRRVAIAAAIAAAVMVPWSAAHLTELVFPHQYKGHDLAAIQLLRRLPAGAQAISDDPGLVWRAGRRTPDSVRGCLDPAHHLEAARAPDRARTPSCARRAPPGCVR